MNTKQNKNLPQSHHSEIIIVNILVLTSFSLSLPSTPQCIYVCVYTCVYKQRLKYVLTKQDHAPYIVL